ncbi:MAG: MFS transporter [Anaerolineae bacterium]|nr:MFS transporter [Anaerolineae bacterium]
MLRFDNVTKVILVNFCTRFHLYIHIYALYLQGRGLTLLEISTLESVVIGTIFLAEVPTGIIADRIGRKWSLVMNTLFLMLAELIFLFSTEYWQFAVLAVLTGIGHAFGSGAREAMVYDSLPREARDSLMKRAIGLVGSWGQIAFFISPIIGGLIIGDLALERVRLAIALTVGALLVGLIIALTLREPQDDWEVSRSGALAIFRTGMRELWESRRLRRITLLTVLTSAFGGTLITTLAPPYLAANQVSPFAIALTLSLGSLLAAGTQRYAYRVEEVLGPHRALTVLTVLPGIAYFVLALISGPLPVWLVVTLMYGTNDMKQPLYSGYQNALITGKSRATVLSLMSMFSSLFVAIMAPVYAALATRSLPLAFVAMGAVILAAAVMLRVDRVVD